MTATLEVVQPGLLTTIQDLGRPSVIASGVPPGGAADRFAHSAANLLAGNAVSEATLECTLSGPALLAVTPCVIAITGADLGPAINDVDAPMWTRLVMAAGDRLAFGRRRSGARTYIAVAGGVDGERWFGSRATYTLAGLGGMHGRPLAAGDVLHGASDAATQAGAVRTLDPALRPDYADHLLAVMPGPHFRRFDAGARRSLFETVFRVTPDTDRMGCRLDGPPLIASGEEVLSFGLVAGALQVTNSGQAILLLADHQTAGGYPVVATVVSASLPVAAQLAPGDEVSFRQVNATQAGARRKALNQTLASLLSVL